MIKYVNGNICDSKSMVIVNPVNCSGVMGNPFKSRFPSYYKDYRVGCNTKVIIPGKLHIHNLNGIYTQYIVSIPTKTNWKYMSNGEYIQWGIIALMDFIKDFHISSVSIAKLSNSGWSRIKRDLETYLSDLPCRIEVYE